MLAFQFHLDLGLLALHLKLHRQLLALKLVLELHLLTLKRHLLLHALALQRHLLLHALLLDLSLHERLLVRATGLLRFHHFFLSAHPVQLGLSGGELTVRFELRDLGLLRALLALLGGLGFGRLLVAFHHLDDLGTTLKAA